MTMILVADDDAKLLKMLRRTLIYEGFEVITAEDGEVALRRIQADHPDLLILDWMMPKMDGLDLVGILREMQDETPILMLTARDAIEDRVEGLNSGADDYLVKPFAPVELVARVNTLLRRTGSGKNKKEPPSFADLELLTDTHEAKRGERAFALTPTEFDLLHFLISHPRQVLHRRQILDRVWGLDFMGDDNVLEVYVGYLRKKTEAGGEPRLLQTIRGVGYILREVE